MLLNGLLRNVDKWLCNYLNIEKEVVQPYATQVSRKKVVVIHTLSFKRHTLKLSWSQFKSTNLSQMNAADRKKLGITVGKSIAKGLIISFEPISIERSSHEN